MQSTLAEISRRSTHITVCALESWERHTEAAIRAELELKDIDSSHVHLAPVSRQGPDVIPRCPLLTPEYGFCPWSDSALMCPAETAWVPLEQSLRDFHGDFAALGEKLDQLVDVAELIHDTARWPTPRMQRDAWLNRRAAIQLTDVGFYAEGRSASSIHRCVGWISARLQARSVYWARRRRPLPSIRDANPSRDMQPSRTREQWQTRWLAAVAASAVRHRNLLALSPWSILAGPSAHRLELLSLLVHADAICLAEPVQPLLAGTEQQQSFQRALRLALQQRHALDQIAKHV